MSGFDHSEVCNRVASAMLCEPIPGQTMTLWDAAKAGVPYFAEGDEADPVVLLGRAAHGDVDAMRDMAGSALHLAMTGRYDVDPIVVLSEGLMFARMAAVRGNEDDAMRVVVMLSLASLFSSEEAATDFAGEALARLELLADGTSKMAEASAQLLAAHTQHETPDTLECAKAYRTRLLETA